MPKGNSRAEEIAKAHLELVLGLTEKHGMDALPGEVVKHVKIALKKLRIRRKPRKEPPCI